MEEKELIKKFLANKCVGQEAAQVRQLLERQPQLLDDWLTLDEWEEGAGLGVTAPQGLKEEIWNGVDRRLQKRQRMVPLLRSLSAAAAVLLLVVSVYFLTGHLRRKVPAPTLAEAVRDSVWIRENTTGSIQRILLPDGSEITLFPGTRLRYADGFRTKRTIWLTAGKALFQVAKDAAHPFTVYSRNISTTALGTRFIVDLSGRQVNVRLYEGKVVINKTNARPVFLLPNEQCFAGDGNDGFSVVPLTADAFSGSAGVPGAAPVENSSADKKGISFYNVPLPEAFDLLEQLYKSRIVYSKQQVARKYFTGRFSAHDSLSTILKLLTSVNDLSSIKESGIYTIGPSLNIPAQPVKPVPRQQLPVFPLSYTNAPLEQVLSDMQRGFGMQLLYDTGALAHKYFTGRITKEDDPDQTLAIICHMNQLKFVVQDHRYFITK